MAIAKHSDLDTETTKVGKKQKFLRLKAEVTRLENKKINARPTSLNVRIRDTLASFHIFNATNTSPLLSLDKDCRELLRACGRIRNTAHLP